MEIHNAVKASEITGVKVKNLLDENLGEINEVVINKTSGEVDYLVLDFGGFLGFGNKFFAVPWVQFTYNNTEDCFILNVDKAHLKDAPGFNKDQWPDFASPEFTASINQYYKSNRKQPGLNQTTTTQPHQMTTALFNDKDSAEKAYASTLQHGYKPEDVNVLMSEDSRKKYYTSPLVKEEIGSKAAQGLGVGGLTGGIVGGTLGAIAAIGTSLVLPGLGLIVAGPLAAGLAGAGAGGITGGLVGALIGWGIPEEKARVYEEGIKSGGIVLGVHEKEGATNIEQDWNTYSNRR